MELNIYRAGVTNVTLQIDEQTRLVQRLMGEDYIEVVLDKAREVYDLDIKDYITHEGNNYYLNDLPEIRFDGKFYHYKIIFESVNYNLGKIQFLLDGESDFYLTGDVDTFVDQIVTNMEREFAGVWSRGVTDQSDETYRTLHFQGESCLGVLNRLTDEFNGEFYFSEDTVGVIRFTDQIGVASGLSFSYGEGNGLREVTQRTVKSDSIITRVYAFGSDRNINSDYRSGKKRLEFASGGNNYLEQNTGTYGTIEAVKYFDHIYPHFDGSVNTISNMTTFLDGDIDFNLNNYLIADLSAKLHFNTGNLAGYTFEIYSFDNTTKEIQLIEWTDEKDLTLPNTDMKPSTGDHYTFLDITMPTAYVSAAETLLLNEAQAFLDDHDEPILDYEVEPDWRHFKDEDISLRVGDTVTITDTDMGINIASRITALTQIICSPYKYTFEVSNETEPSLTERNFSGFRDIISRLNIEGIGDIERALYSPWTHKGAHSGRTFQTDSGQPGHYKRVVLNADDNTLEWYNDANTRVIIIDDNILGSRPGILLTDGIFYNYKDGDNWAYMLSNAVAVQDSRTGGLFGTTTISGTYEVETADDDLWRIAIDAHAIIGTSGSDDIYGVKSYVRNAGTGDIHSGYFDGGDFLIRLGDHGGVNKFYIQDDDENVIFAIDSEGVIEMDELHLTNSASNKPILWIENTHTDGNCGTIDFYKNSATPADNDDLGAIDAWGETSTSAKHRYAYILFESADITNGTEAGAIILNVDMNGSPREVLAITGYDGTEDQGEFVFNNTKQYMNYYIYFGDNAAGNKMSWYDSDNAEVALLDSNGNFACETGIFGTSLILASNCYFSLEGLGDTTIRYNSAASEIEIRVNNTINLRIEDTKFGVFNTAPQAQQAHIVDADGTLPDITTKFNMLLADLEGYGLLADA